MLKLESSYHPDGKLTFCLLISTLTVHLGSNLVIPGRSKCQTRLQNPIAPWKLTFCSLFAGRWCRSLGRNSVNRELPDLLQHSLLCASSFSKFPIAPMQESCFARCLQGGGVFVWGGTVTISSCTIIGNTALAVRVLMFKSSHGTDGKIADVLASTHACTTSNTSVNYRGYVPQRP